MYLSGELAQVVGPQLGSDEGEVRAAAVGALGAVLLLPEVTRAAAGSAGMRAVCVTVCMHGMMTWGGGVHLVIKSAWLG